MKKVLITLLALVLALGSLSALADEVYKSDFAAAGMDGWFANNATGKITEDGAFLITGRTQDWMAPKRVFDLQPGVAYKVSVEVYQDGQDTAAFQISVEQDGANWVNLVAADAPKGEWTTLEATFTLEQFKEYSLYVETVGAPTLDYQIRNFVIETADAEEAPAEEEKPARTFTFGKFGE